VGCRRDFDFGPIFDRRPLVRSRHCDPHSLCKRAHSRQDATVARILSLVARLPVAFRVGPISVRAISSRLTESKIQPAVGRFAVPSMGGEMKLIATVLLVALPVACGDDSGGSGGSSGSGGGGAVDAFDPHPGDIRCGNGSDSLTCTRADPYCCLTFSPPSTYLIPRCAQSCSGGESAFLCDGPEDCINQKCCASWQGSNRRISYCLQNFPDCPTYPPPQPSDQLVCHVSSTCPATAPHCCTAADLPFPVCVASPPMGATCY
jgi:hypothetical protein